jgi:hypothetical protein
MQGKIRLIGDHHTYHSHGDELAVIANDQRADHDHITLAHAENLVKSGGAAWVEKPGPTAQPKVDPTQARAMKSLAAR